MANSEPFRALSGVFRVSFGGLSEALSEAPVSLSGDFRASFGRLPRTILVHVIFENLENILSLEGDVFFFRNFRTSLRFRSARASCARKIDKFAKQ